MHHPLKETFLEVQQSSSFLPWVIKQSINLPFSSDQRKKKATTQSIINITKPSP
jgi:hypothetical protein